MVKVQYKSLLCSLQVCISGNYSSGVILRKKFTMHETNTIFPAIIYLLVYATKVYFFAGFPRCRFW